MSLFAWLDYSEADRQRALDILDRLREKGTVDELGIGTVRDAMADVLFPGTSTIMTRARYYFFIPWIYRELERKKVASSEIAHRARRAEIQLIESLVLSGEKDGVIGIDARRDLKRLPSTIYWQGLGVLGFRHTRQSREAYHRSLDRFYRVKSDQLLGDDGNRVAGERSHNWDPMLPDAPVGFPDAATLDLTPDEANYFCEAVRRSAPESYFAHLVWNLEEFENGEMPWDEPLVVSLPGRASADVAHARNFSDAMLGAALTYNLMLATKLGSEELIATYEQRVGEWADNIKLRRAELVAWDRRAFWTTVGESGRQVPPAARTFIDQWLDRVVAVEDPASLAEDSEVREGIRAREYRLKGNLARLHNRSALEQWGGASSAAAFDFRWNRPTRWLLGDLKEALVTV